MQYYVVGSGESVDTTEEESDNYKEAKVIFESDELDDALGFLMILMEEKTSEIWQHKHVKILDENGIEKYFYFQYQWLPHNNWFRLNPPPEKIKAIVKNRGEHLCPNMLKTIHAYRRDQSKAA